MNLSLFRDIYNFGSLLEFENGFTPTMYKIMHSYFKDSRLSFLQTPWDTRVFSYRIGVRQVT